MGSPFRLNDVFKTMGCPVFSPRAVSNSWYRGLASSSTTWMRAVPSMWVMDGMSAFWSSRTGTTMSIHRICRLPPVSRNTVARAREDRWRERPETLAKPDLLIDAVLHVGVPWICQNRAVAQGSRSPFKAPAPIR